MKRQSKYRYLTVNKLHKFIVIRVFSTSRELVLVMVLGCWLHSGNCYARESLQTVYLQLIN